MISVGALRDRIKEGPRLRRFLHGAVSAFAGKGTALLVSLVTIPITVRYLGPVAYGIWITISTTVVMLGVLDLGIASTLTNYIAKANALGDREMARNYYATAFYLTLGLAGLFAVLGYFVWTSVAWGPFFGVHDGVLARQATLCVGIAVLFFLINLPLTLASRVLNGFQQVEIGNYFAMVGSLLSMAAIVLGIKAHVTVTGLMALFCGAALVGRLLLNLWLVFRDRPWIRPRFTFIRMGLARDLFGEGIQFFILQIAGLVVYNSDNFVITHYLGAGEVTPYSVASKLMSLVATLQSLVTPVLWPAFSDAFHRGDLAWVRKTYHRVAAVTMTAVVILTVLFALTGRGIIRIWATSAAVPSSGLLWAMAIWTIVLCITTNQACLLASAQRIKLQAISSCIAAVVNLIASIYLVRFLGSVGVILGSLLSYLVFILAPQGWEVRNILRGRYSGGAPTPALNKEATEALP